MDDRSGLLTEQRLLASMRLDEMPIAEAVDLMNAQDAVAVGAVGTQRAAIAQAVEVVVEALRGGGRLFYVGAGTSGRLGVLDAAECPPTFRTDPQQIQGIVAGGDAAMFRAREGVEDRADDGAAAIDSKAAGAGDVVMGIAAGGTTPFVHGALRRPPSGGANDLSHLRSSRAPRARGRRDRPSADRPGSAHRLHAAQSGNRHEARAQHDHHACNGSPGKGVRESDGRPPRDQSKVMGPRGAHCCLRHRTVARRRPRAASEGGRAREAGDRDAKARGGVRRGATPS